MTFAAPRKIPACSSFAKPTNRSPAKSRSHFLPATKVTFAETPFLGDKHLRLKILIPDSLATDMAVNIFTYDPGATLPFVETHVMEHGMLFLSGGGVYRLDADWHPVTAGDAIWIAPYCPQWFIASGPGPARYIYYKDVNRLPLWRDCADFNQFPNCTKISSGVPFQWGNSSVQPVAKLSEDESMAVRKLRTKIFLVLLSVVLFLVLVIAALPLWFPWALRPIAKRYGATYAHYQRVGYQRFQLSNFTLTNGPTHVQAQRSHRLCAHGLVVAALDRRTRTSNF